MSIIRPLPEITGYAKQYWNGVAQGKLLIQQCTGCGGYQHYARPVCVTCAQRDPVWVEAVGKATVLSHTTVYRSPYDDMKKPYVVALIKLEEGPVMLSHVVGCEPEQVRCDQPVRLTFAPLRDEVQLPVFEPDPA